MAGHCLDKSAEAQLRSISGNNVCCDCDGKLPQWASVSFGIFMCLECSGRHRALGVHISFVRSVSMDSWTEKQIKLMRSGGNDALNEFLQSYGVSKTTSIPLKYNSPAALLYKDRLLAAVEGRALPSELPKVETSNASSLQQGSDPLPGESEADYVARQRKLQAEAKERMRAKFGNSTGLTSGGVMQGIGSDASYRPGEANADTGLAGVSSKAISLLSSSFAMLGETVTKATTSEGDQPAPIQAAAVKGWAAAIDLWNKASEATTDLVRDLSKPEDEAYRFPRPNSNPTFSASSSSATSGIGYSGSAHSNGSNSSTYGNNANNNSTTAGASSTSFYRNEQQQSKSADNMPSLAKPSSWDEDEFDANSGSSSNRAGGRRPSNRPPKSTSSSNNSGTVSPASPLKASPELPPPPQSLRGASPAMAPSPVTRGVTPPPVVSSRGTSPALPGASSQKVKTADAPSGDDFFATFGV